MALTKEIIVDKIEVIENGVVQVRTATRVLEDGTQLSQAYHRHFLEPSTKDSGSWADTDISGQDARVQAIANATWTAEVKTAFRDYIDAETL